MTRQHPGSTLTAHLFPYPTLFLSAIASSLPPPPGWLGRLDALYDADIRVPGLEDRRFAPEHWWKLALPLATEARGFRVETIGGSAEGRPLRHEIGRAHV